MNTQDQALLQDIVQFTYLNHLAKATILYLSLERGVEELEQVARYALMRYRSYPSPEGALADARTYNDAKRVEKVVCAHIFAELIGACEDLGAFGYAVRERNNGGIFTRYLDSKTADARNFLDDVLRARVVKAESVTLETLLHLPKAKSLANALPADRIANLEMSYRALAVNLWQAATIYSMQSEKVRELGNDHPAQSTSPDDINVFLGFAPTAASPRTTKPMQQKRVVVGTLARAFNKLKHTFMVTEDLPAYAPAAGERALEYITIGSGSDDFTTIFKNVGSVVGTTVEIASILITLCQFGIAI